MIIKVDKINIERILRDAVEMLKNGGIVAYPTETFYGLGAKFDIENSLKRLYDMKKRPQDKAMPLIIGDTRLLSIIAAHADKKAITLIECFWPGPLTLILPARKSISAFLTAGTHRVAVRVPGESFALHLARAAGFPITATSANPSGLSPARDADTVFRYFGDHVDLIIDAGPSPGGLPSTIVEATNDGIKVLREGVIRKESLFTP